MSLRDQEYYFEDGSCVFLVDGYLFNIHYSLLAQESPVFNKMFSLPQPESTDLELKGRNRGRRSSEMEGGSDDNPIVCHDSVDSFRALCWGIYARPADIRAQQDAATVDLKRLMLLAEITHKYDCIHLERWSLDLLRSHWASSFDDINSGRVPDLSRIVWTSEILENLLVLSNQSDILDPTFRKNIEAQWLSLAFPETMTSADLRKSLDFADSLNNVRQKGLAYYRALRRIGTASTTPSAVSDFAKMIELSGTPDALMSELTLEQRGRLMRGLWCLNSLQQYSIGSVLVNEPHAGCPSTSTHQYHWQSFWTSYQSFSGDPGMLLELGLRRASKRNEWGVTCWSELKPKIEEMLRTFEDNLSKYFMVA